MTEVHIYICICKHSRMRKFRKIHVDVVWYWYECGWHRQLVSKRSHIAQHFQSLLFLLHSSLSQSTHATNPLSSQWPYMFFSSHFSHFNFVALVACILLVFILFCFTHKWEFPQISVCIEINHRMHKSIFFHLGFLRLINIFCLFPRHIIEWIDFLSQSFGAFPICFSFVSRVVRVKHSKSWD